MLGGQEGILSWWSEGTAFFKFTCWDLISGDDEALPQSLVISTRPRSLENMGLYIWDYLITDKIPWINYVRL